MESYDHVTYLVAIAWVLQISPRKRQKSFVAACPPLSHVLDLGAIDPQM